MKKPPQGWPQISSALFYQDASSAIDWLCRAFGFEVQIKIDGEGGQIVHSELDFGEGRIMVSTAEKSSGQKQMRSPQSVGGANTQSLFVYVDDVDAHFARARAAGAKILKEPTTIDYGEGYWSDRGYQCADPEGHLWGFAQRLGG